jgi:hypothetical protein
MAEIAIDFLMGPGPSSKLISWFGQGPGGYSHCAGVLADGRYIDARNDKLGGVPPGVHIREPDTEPWVRKRRATLEVTQAEYDHWEVNARAKIGDAYGRSDILEFIFDRGKHDPGHYVCSAYQINEVQNLSRLWSPGHRGYVPFPLPVPAHQLSPNAALLILATAGFTIGPIQLPGIRLPDLHDEMSPSAQRL